MNVLLEHNKVTTSFSMRELEDIGRYKKFKKVYYLSDVIQVDKAEIDAEILMHKEGSLR